MSALPLLLLSPHDDAAAAGLMAFGCVFWVFIMAIAFGMLAFQVWLFWRIFSKAGYSGALSLLLLIPAFGVLIALCMLAFGDWPALRRRDG